MGVIQDRYGEFSHAPLTYTLFMLRFPQEARLSQPGEMQMPPVILDIQAKLKGDYPILEKQDEQGIQFSQTIGGQSFTTFNIPEFHFLSDDRKRAVVIKADRLIFHTSDYPDFPTFANWLRSIIDNVMGILNIRVFNSIGLRYIDTIIGESAQHPSKAVNGQLQPFKMNIVGVEHGISQYLNVYTTPFGQLIFKSYFSESVTESAIIPPDLVSLASKLKLRDVPQDGASVLLDYDHNYTVEGNAVEQLDLDDLFDRLKSMHDISSSAFVETVNEDYVGNWK